MDLERLKHFAEEGIPFNQFLGFKVVDLNEGYARIDVPTRPEFIGDVFRPALHGGIISTLADTVGGIAAFTRLERNQRVSTVDMRIDYLRPASVEKTLVGEGRVLRLGNRVAVTEMLVHQGDPEMPVARGSAVYNVVTVREIEPD
jgi:uncharacterized protein (TIGR00369 family)